MQVPERYSGNVFGTSHDLSNASTCTVVHLTGDFATLDICHTMSTRGCEESMAFIRAALEQLKPIGLPTFTAIFEAIMGACMKGVANRIAMGRNIWKVAPLGDSTEDRAEAATMEWWLYSGRMELLDKLVEAAEIASRGLLYNSASYKTSLERLGSGVRLEIECEEEDCTISVSAQRANGRLELTLDVCDPDVSVQSFGGKTEGKMQHCFVAALYPNLQIY